ncbi:hypothetical protein NIES4072_20060 [Nostoc commune NIES-4072]|uniref:Uncharacterized protein n=1 Tax=Nostoc commune NIES-4072 TaxID=2005467 RepID=A0A2R5FI18_NOSCO|nr:hypothetical protein NIES4070_06740 [Nostoc commune HK-02]GBG18342.1 hypothetical protein NIES4072_20060 [Nostoc commune NIES-4072]
MLYATLSSLARTGFINVCSFNFETNTYKQKEYVHSIKLKVVSFIVVTGGILFANPLVIAQTTPVKLFHI